MSNVPALAPLSAVSDDNTRVALQRIYDTLRARGEGSEKWLTGNDLANAFRAVNITGSSTGALGGIDNPFVPQYLAWVKPLLQTIEDTIQQSRIYKDLTSELQGINTGLVVEQQSRIDAVQGVAADLADEAIARLQLASTLGSQITSLQDVNASQATQISGIATRVTGAESSIVTLQNTTSSQAQSLTSLTTRVGSAETNITSLQTTTSTQAQSLTSISTRIGAAETNISTLNTTTANQATTLTSVSALAGSKAKVFVQTTTPVSTASYTLATNDLWLDSDDSNKSYRWNGTAWVDVSDARLASNAAAITAETTARVSADTALTNSINTQVATLNGSISTLQTSYNTLSSSTGANTSAITSLQTTVSGVNTKAQSALTLAQSAEGSINGAWTVKFNAAGQAIGVGLGIEGKGGTVSSTFVVVADKFMVARPDGSGAIPMLEMGAVNGVNVLGFKGTLIGADGYFTGQLAAATGTFTGELMAATGTFAGSLSAGTVDISKLIGATYRYESPGSYNVTVPTGYTSMRVTIIGGGGGGGSGSYGEWNIHGGGGGGGGAGQYRIYAWDGLAAGATVTVSVGAGGAGSTELFQSGFAGGVTDIYYNGSRWLRAEPGGGGGRAGGSGWVNNGYGEEPGGGGSGYPSGNAGSGSVGGNGANSQWGGTGGVGRSNWYGGAATGFGAGGAGGGYDGGTGNNGRGSAAKYDGWFPGGAGSAGRAIIEFYNPNSVVLRTEFTSLQTRFNTLESQTGPSMTAGSIGSLCVGTAKSYYYRQSSGWMGGGSGWGWWPYQPAPNDLTAGMFVVTGAVDNGDGTVSNIESHYAGTWRCLNGSLFVRAY